MKVAFKLISCLIIGVIALVAVDAFVSIRRERSLFRSEMRHDAGMLGYTIKDLVTDVWRDQGPDRALALIDDANRDEQRIRIRWVWLNASDGVGYHPHVAPPRILRQLDKKPHVTLTAPDDAGSLFLYTYIPVDVGDPRPGALELSEPMSHVNDYTRRTMAQTLMLASGLVLCSAVAASLFGIRFIGRPLDRLMKKLQRIGHGDLSGPLALKRRDEFGMLAHTLDNMCEDLKTTQQSLQSETAARIKAIEELRHADRLRTVGRLSAGVAHELGTPLNVVSERASIIREECGEKGEVAASARIIEQQAEHMADIVRQLLAFARRMPSEKELTDVRRLSRETVGLLRSLAEKRQVRLRAEASTSDDTMNILAFKSQIQQVFTNLIDNAVEASPDRGEVFVSVIREPIQSPKNELALQPGEYARIDVRDQGNGIEAEDVEQIFEPFYTTKEVGEGTGLGLSIAYAIVEERGGWIDVKSEAGAGTCFSVYLPICSPDAPAESNGRTRVVTRT